jgi:hypothetical protein
MQRLAITVRLVELHLLGQSPFLKAHLAVVVVLLGLRVAMVVREAVVLA